MSTHVSQSAGWFSCCDHCECRAGERTGHDDTCSHGCNDAEMGPE